MKVTLITGASSGIGEAFARRLASDGHDLVLVARSETRLHEICDELMLRHKITAHYVVLDLALPGADERLFSETQKHGFEVEWLINNAGFGSMGDFAVLDMDHELNMIRVNVLGAYSIDAQISDRNAQPRKRNHHQCFIGRRVSANSVYGHLRGNKGVCHVFCRSACTGKSCARHTCDGDLPGADEDEFFSGIEDH